VSRTAVSRNLAMGIVAELAFAVAAAVAGVEGAEILGRVCRAGWGRPKIRDRMDGLPALRSRLWLEWACDMKQPRWLDLGHIITLKTIFSALLANADRGRPNPAPNHLRTAVESAHIPPPYLPHSRPNREAGRPHAATGSFASRSHVTRAQSYPCAVSAAVPQLLRRVAGHTRGSSPRDAGADAAAGESRHGQCPPELALAATCKWWGSYRSVLH
jgi:hypothetical protein